jgi:hypothetical protein
MHISIAELNVVLISGSGECIDTLFLSPRQLTICHEPDKELPYIFGHEVDRDTSLHLHSI